MKKKVVMITGVSSGIGQATARALARAGHRAFGGARAPDGVGPIEGVELDVGDEASVNRCVDSVIRIVPVVSTS